MDRKIIFIPGWMNTLETYKKYEGLEIWKDKFNISENLKTNFVIGHSLGANYIIHNFEKFPESKIILYNPLLPKRNWFDWIKRFSKFHKEEGLFKERVLVIGPIYYIAGLLRAIKMTRSDLFLKIEKIPKEKIVLLKGIGDKYLCTADDAKKISEMGIRVIEVPEAGHNWNLKIINEIEKIIDYYYEKKD